MREPLKGLHIKGFFDTLCGTRKFCEFMKMQRLVMLIGVVFFSGCAHAEYPSARYLRERLTKRQYVRGEKKGEYPYFHTIPSAYKNALSCCKKNGDVSGLTSLINSNVFLFRNGFEENYSEWNPEKEFRKFCKKNPDDEFNKCFSKVKSCKKYEDLCLRIRRCEQVLRSEEFWKKMLGDNFFNALVEQCNKGKDAASVRLSVEGVSHKLLDYKWREIETLNCECMLDSLSDRFIYIVSLVQQRKEMNENGDKESVTDFEIHLKLSVDMEKEEVVGAAIFDRFVVNKPVCDFPYDRVIFNKNIQKLIDKELEEVERWREEEEESFCTSVVRNVKAKCNIF